MHFAPDQNSIDDGVQSGSCHFFTGLLRPGEKLLWADQPRPTNNIRLKGQPVLLFGAFWVLFFAALVYVLWNAENRGSAFLWCAVSVIVVLIVVAKFRGDAQQRAITHYALTESRIIIHIGGRFLPVSSIDLSSIGDITLSDQSGEIGTLTFYAPGTISKGYRLLPTFFPSTSPIAEFIQVRNAERVRDEIKRMQYPSRNSLSSTRA